MYSWDILQFILEKSLNLDLKNTGTTFTGLVLTLLYIGFGLEKYSDYLTGLRMILYVGIGLEKYSNYLTGFELT